MNKDSIYFNEYVSNNIPYKFQDYTPESRRARTILSIGDVNNNYRYAVPYEGRDRYQTLFSKTSVAYISGEVTKRLKGVHPEGKNIIVPDATILSVMESVHHHTENAYIEEMYTMIISYIVNQIKNEYDVTATNNKLSIWTTNYTLDTGMQRFDGIKLNNKSRLNYTRWTY